MRRLFLVAALALLLFLTSAAEPRTASAQSVSEAGALMVQAGRYEAASRRELRKAAREHRLAAAAAKKAKKTRAPGARKRLRRSARKHRVRAALHRKRARRQRKRAARLRRRAAQLGQVRAALVRRPPIPLGTAIDWSELQADPALERLFLDHFGQMSPENELKLFALQPRQGVYNFYTADRMVDWALSHGKRVRGHTLVYGNQLPHWMTSRAWTRDELLAVMRDHIETVMRHFHGRVAEWDVVNEAVGSWGDGWVHNLWYDVIGPDYVDQAFRFARAADPDAQLFYNDYGTELPDHPKTVRARALVSHLVSAGVPIDGVGLESHVSNQFKADGFEVAETMRRFAAMGLDVAVTEMDVRTNGGGPLAAELDTQRTTFGGSARACRMEPRCTSFTTWGISDRYSWFEVPELAPLMFDASMVPKPAFWDVEDWVRKP